MEGSGPPSDLITFTDPPVNEVYMSVQFPEPVSDEGVALGDFWPRIRQDFPQLERRAALPPIEERFEAAPQPPPFRIEAGPLPQRYWFVSEDSTRLIQVQPDRFFFNWRQAQPGEEYPRYRNLRPDFERYLATFLDSLPVDKRERARPDWCEVAYINHVHAPGEGTTPHLSLHRILRFVAEPSAEGLTPLEDMQLQARSVRTDGEVPTGRMYLSAMPGFRTEDQAPIYVLELTVRGRPSEDSPEGVLTFCDRARELIVTGFREVTTDEMHARWGLEGTDDASG